MVQALTRLTPPLQAMVDELLSTGHFADAEEVLVEALRLLEDREATLRLQASLIEAEEQTRRGQTVEWSPLTRATI